MDYIKKILTDLPAIHTGETEIISAYEVSNRSIFSSSLQKKLSDNETFCWALGEPVLRYLDSILKSDFSTLEIGSGTSTFVFAQNGCQHKCITPSKEEVERIMDYARQENISLEKVNFINEYSEFAAPQLQVSKQFDVILIDGKHAFPWPFLDWFYTVLHLKKGGILLVDDTHLTTGKILSDFMKSDPSWKFIETLDQKTCVFRKEVDDIRDIAWHMQPFVTKNFKENYYKKVKGLLRKIIRNFK